VIRTRPAAGPFGRSAALLLAALSLLAACASSQATTAPPAKPSKPASPPASTTSSQLPATTKAGTHWSLSWAANFSKPGARSKWLYYDGSFGENLHQLQWYDAQNASFTKTGLVITASKNGHQHECWYGPCKYTSARLETKNTFTQTYGLFEARIKMPPGEGLWPAFWIEGADVYQVGWPTCGEVDIVEPSSKNPYLLQGFAHALHLNYDVDLTLPDSMTSGYHTYGLDWTPKGITWYFDGHAYAHMKAYKGWPFRHRFFVILNLAVGTTDAYSGPVNSSTPFPAHMDVAWVRVYRQVK
jgi:beta-glucanase (GH16 family)